MMARVTTPIRRMTEAEYVDHLVNVAHVLEDAAFAYQQAIGDGDDTVIAVASALLDRARAASGTARFLAHHGLGIVGVDDGEG